MRAVDGLGKQVVLERPATFDVADQAIERFADLDSSYDAMLTAHEKAKTLESLPGLRQDFEAAQERLQLIDTFGVTRTGDTPFLLWQLRTRDRLLTRARQTNQEAYLAGAVTATSAREQERPLTTRLAQVRQEQRDNGGDALETLAADIEQLTAEREARLERRAVFDDRVHTLDLPTTTRQEFTATQCRAEEFFAAFDSQFADLI